LDDYTEDVRVELEIRILDEEVLGRGYETLLMCSPPSGEEWNEEEILAFVNGTDPIIAKALKNFENKLRDLEEDIAVVKKVVYSFHDDDDDNDDDDDDNNRQEKMISTPESLSTDTLVASPNQGWISSWISPSRSTTPIPPLLPPPQQSSNLTFGNIMTNRPRNISSSSSSSSSLSNSNSILRRTVSSLNLSSSPSPALLHHGSSIHSRMTTGDIIKILQLKTSMPELLVNGNEQLGNGKEEEISTFSSLSSITPITSTTRSSSFVIGMGMIGRGPGAGGGRGGRGMLGVVGMNERRRRVVSAVAAATASSSTSGTTVLKKIVDVGDREGGKGFSKEDVD
jgi:hypothetical protein